MKAILKSLLAILVGMVTAMIVIIAIQALSTSLHPMPEGVSPDDAEAMADYIGSLPVMAFVLVLISYFIATLDGVMLASWLAPNSPRAHGAVVFALLASGAVLNLLTIPHPGWFVGATLVVYLVAFAMGDFIGQKLHRQRVQAA